jgi:hypothetical protein
MPRRELVLLASRALALLYFTSALSDVTYVPERLFALSHYWNQNSALLGHNYATNDYLIIIASLVLRILAYLLIATLLWRCGPRVERLFSPPQEGKAVSGQDDFS